MPPPFALEILDEFHAKRDFHEHDLGNRLSDAIKKSLPNDPHQLKATLAETWAFLFHPHDRLRQGKGPWNTHFGPWIVFGDRSEPDIRNIDAEVIDYWTHRTMSIPRPWLGLK